MSMNCCVYELLCLWIVVSMNCCVYELLCLWIVVSMNFCVYELFCIWIVVSVNYCVYELLYLQIVVSMNCCVYLLLYLWIVMSMNCCENELLWKWIVVSMNCLVNVTMSSKCMNFCKEFCNGTFLNKRIKIQICISNKSEQSFFLILLDPLFHITPIPFLLVSSKLTEGSLATISPSERSPLPPDEKLEPPFLPQTEKYSQLWHRAPLSG